MTIVGMALILALITYALTFKTEFNSEDLQKSMLLLVAVGAILFFIAVVSG